MEKVINNTCILSSSDVKQDVNDKSVYSIKTHLVLIDNLFKS